MLLCRPSHGLFHANVRKVAVHIGGQMKQGLKIVMEQTVYGREPDVDVHEPSLTTRTTTMHCLDDSGFSAARPCQQPFVPADGASYRASLSNPPLTGIHSVVGYD